MVMKMTGILSLFYVHGCFAYMYVCVPHHMCVWCPRKPEESIESCRMVVTDGSGLPCSCWELNPDPPEEQSMLLTPEASLQSHVRHSKALSSEDGSFIFLAHFYLQ